LPEAGAEGRQGHADDGAGEDLLGVAAVDGRSDGAGDESPGHGAEDGVVGRHADDDADDDAEDGADELLSEAAEEVPWS
jgi:hypothetical protein